MKTIFNDRKDAGQALAQRLVSFIDERDVLVLAVSRGGVPVAYEVARTLRLPFGFCGGQADLPEHSFDGKTVILVDEGIETGATMTAAVAAVRSRSPKYLIIAVPVAPLSAVWDFRAEVNEFVTVLAPARAFVVRQWYRDFAPVTDEEVNHLLNDAIEPVATT